jgi:hypothetical protein
MKPKTKTIVFIFLSFLIGILCGWFLESRLINRTPHMKGRGQGDLVKLLTERLRLDERQVAQVDSILECNRKKMDVYKKQALAMRDTTRIEIRKILNAEQGKQFDEFNQERDKWEAKKHEKEPPKK